ncbi:E3 ubiquitin-protein ligase RHA1B-like [Rhodamnia argentea]|uniref:E3 ubiquitin-protein ligase RHA1B-like n=1 Tax=Rhodamnia argentea TaxID=178133 RepID=A0ABM3HC14_9MYRT|nr:E3 ubiquitin-protein ligase RHA1B-like [Rhodamnia argentea]
MGLLLGDSSCCLIVTHVLYKAALVFAVMRWVLSWALRLRDRITTPSSSSSSSSSSVETEHAPSVSSQMIRDNLVLTTYGDAMERLPQICDTCAVCLSQLREDDEVRELRNCCHVFHRECIDRWVDHDGHQDHDHDHDDNHKSCPLCRAPLLTPSQNLDWSLNEPSWAVERLLYLFGDDLLL